MTRAKTKASKIKAWKKDISGLSYEEATQALDLILEELQSDSVPIADLQNRVLHGEVVLEHCEALLKTVEQAVLQLDPESMIETNNLNESTTTVESSNA
ncbi:exodeoxyribonuclease VII small subunit [Synechococcus sp. BL107]|uniref:exodeoxyribonuclease VII small subunit n=1 Tax=Synechococcus sp. BL107 TaxID=313625 RepID=UPI0000E54387|nr:exodeoxyribonuclease VII small subunit [Synechococcus sp. BL107]EAU72603.1 exodeoxyribonuclease VII small subunit [Synechococcus sp. BL107]